MSRHALPRRSPRDLRAPGGAADRSIQGAVARTHARPAASLPGRRPALLLSAAVVGALVAALPIGAGASAPATPVVPAAVAAPLDVMLMAGPASGVAVPDGNGEVAARQGLSAADAEARLEVLAADRAARAARAERASRAAAAARAEAARPKFVLPVKGRLTSCFCQRWGTMHWGIDIAAPMYTPILAVADAVVITAGPASGFGNLVELRHEDGTVSVYGHMETVEVSVGDVVSAGDLIAKVGSRGYSTGPHLHLEIYPDGRSGGRVDPVRWLAERGIAV